LNILGINAYHGDASACIVRDGQLVVAIAEERFNRQKHCAGFPGQAIQECLKQADMRPEDLDHVAISRNPSAHLHRKVLNVALNFFPRMVTVKDRLANVGKVRNIDQELCQSLGVPRSAVKAKFHNVEHHRAHLASAFFVSPFEEAACLSVDGFGDFVSTMTGHGVGNKIDVLDWVEYPHSLGTFYTATTQYLGFNQYGDEGKVMGLAPYGTPRYIDKFRQIVRLLPNGLFELNLDFFTHHSLGVEMTWDSGTPILGPIWSAAYADTFGQARKRGEPIDQRHQDIAASLQTMTEEALEHICNELHRKVPVDRLCLAGGVALNCTFNGMIRERTAFKDVFIQPAAGDDGTAVGAAYWVLNQVSGKPRSFVMRHPYTGSAFSDDQIASIVEQRSIRAHQHAGMEETARETARLMADGNVVGWFQGAMEYGPRALGNRSIVVDPRRAEMKDVLNSRIKRREPFRPFAPSILLEEVGNYFEQDYPSPFMLMAYRVREDKRSAIPAVTHVDGTGRLQTVDRDVNPVYWGLIKAFQEHTGVPVILNTSFNENEPIVRTPDEALNCFLKTRMDVLVMGNFIILKSEQESEVRRGPSSATSANDSPDAPIASALTSTGAGRDTAKPVRLAS
jgi:carbamoyltransferase